ncbi:FGGY-family carbohydrate kinase [Sinisalibacter aestuarii]|uniref:Carbohydrate kinase n=1 Tax=Sinisalibacter aestuarii TaxID=2949426 RepID=A0ABQ5LY11_9RHOB|nr:FGGY-family carbohydrate kinase [Sinisalibacter aestuarii]GKY89854.1 carbohydrate kinase [Sinisalibacter aestuarii]
MTHVAVFDIGKTNAKLALVDLDTLGEIAVVTRPNKVLPGPPWPHFDLDGHWGFLLDALGAFHREHGVDAISVTTHGAAAVLLAADGSLAAPMLDYEHTGPDEMATAYDEIRPPFSETGSPRLPMGLNLGAQIHWMFATDPELARRTATIVTYPQYWGYRLTGVTATDVSSLGCHTDLWNPEARGFSSLVDRLGIAETLAPARPSAEVLGTVLPDIALHTGLSTETPVHVGIHDSNASLLPYVLGRKAPFSVVSTGTWVISMAVGGDPVALDPNRDTLVNVNALGDPVPSARFMGGREWALAMQGAQVDPGEAAMAEVLDSGIMLLPALVSESGPFQGREAHWVGAEPATDSPQRGAAMGFYLALVVAECLNLIGHRGPVVVEGPFARNRAFIAMLAVASGSPIETAASTTGTSEGAALLAATGKVLSPNTKAHDDASLADRLTLYRKAWKAALEA